MSRPERNPGRHRGLGRRDCRPILSSATQYAGSVAESMVRGPAGTSGLDRREPIITLAGCVSMSSSGLASHPAPSSHIRLEYTSADGNSVALAVQMATTGRQSRTQCPRTVSRRDFSSSQPVDELQSTRTTTWDFTDCQTARRRQGPGAAQHDWSTPAARASKLEKCLVAAARWMLIGLRPSLPAEIPLAAPRDLSFLERQYGQRQTYCQTMSA